MNHQKRLKIGEVSKLLNIPAYVIRYWETEFSELIPDKSRAGQRLYNQEKLDFLRKIASLRYSEKLTVDGCKERLKQEKTQIDSPDIHLPDKDGVLKKIQTIKKGLQDVLEALG